jgi:hypothetical protein
MKQHSQAIPQGFVLSPFLPNRSVIAKHTMGSASASSSSWKGRARPADTLPETDDEGNLEGGGPDGGWYFRGNVDTPSLPPHGFVSPAHKPANPKKKSKPTLAARTPAPSRRRSRLQRPANINDAPARKPLKSISRRKSTRVSSGPMNMRLGGEKLN